MQNYLCMFLCFLFYSEDEVSKKKPIEWQIEKKKKIQRNRRFLRDKNDDF